MTQAFIISRYLGLAVLIDGDLLYYLAHARS
jgi:hypothetical protein